MVKLKHQSEIAYYRPGKPDMISQHASVKLDMLSLHANHRQAIPTCIARVIVYKGKATYNHWTSSDSEIAVDVTNWLSNNSSIVGT